MEADSRASCCNRKSYDASVTLLMWGQLMLIIHDVGCCFQSMGQGAQGMGLTRGRGLSGWGLGQGAEGSVSRDGAQGRGLRGSDGAQGRELRWPGPKP